MEVNPFIDHVYVSVYVNVTHIYSPRDSGSIQINFIILNIIKCNIQMNFKHETESSSDITSSRLSDKMNWI